MILSPSSYGPEIYIGFPSRPKVSSHSPSHAPRYPAARPKSRVRLEPQLTRVPDRAVDDLPPQLQRHLHGRLVPGAEDLLDVDVTHLDAAPTPVRGVDSDRRGVPRGWSPVGWPVSGMTRRGGLRTARPVRWPGQGHCRGGSRGPGRRARCHGARCPGCSLSVWSKT